MYNDFRIWSGGYEDEYLDSCGVDIMTWPESQDLMEMPDWEKNTWLINDEEGLDLFGSSAYIYNKDWYEENA